MAALALTAGVACNTSWLPPGWFTTAQNKSGTELNVLVDHGVQAGKEWTRVAESDFPL